MDRRGFFRRSKAAGLGIATGLTILPHARSVWGAPAGEQLSLAVVGLRNRELVLATAFAQRADCHIKYLCDADSSLNASRTDSMARMQGGTAPRFVQDFRQALDDRSVDAVVVATPDHWHCLAAIWACEAGKGLFGRSAESRSVGRPEGRRGREKTEANRCRRYGLPQFHVWPQA